MNYMGTNNNMTQTGGFQPASGRMSAAQRMFVRNHPQHMRDNEQFGHGCGNNAGMMNQEMTGGAINDTFNRNTGSNMMVSAGTNSNMQSNTPVPVPVTSSGGTQSISLTPETLTNTDFLPAYLSQYIGHWIRADFFIGDTIEQRVGVLHEVGASYLIIEAIEPATLIVCDMFSLRFVTIILDDDFTRLMRF